MATLLAVLSDTHIGSTVALSLPEFTSDDGRVSRASPVQAALYAWWQDAWRTVYRRLTPADTLIIVLNGDAVDGPGHHGTPQSVSHNPADELKHAQALLSPLRDMADAFFVVRGTESHVGVGHHTEETLARLLGAEADGANHAWMHLPLEVEGVLFHFTHHGRVGNTLHTKANPTGRLAAEHYYRALSLGRRPADVIVRSHHHRFADSGTTLPTRAIQTPAWQLKTHYVSRHYPDENDISDIGLVLFTCEDGDYRVEWIGRDYVPVARQPWRFDDYRRGDSKRDRRSVAYATRE